jgi:hypothetical protein
MRTTAIWAVLGMLLAFLPRTAHACSWPGSAITSSLPHPGDVEVATDVAPIIRGYWEKNSVKWEAEDGTPVEFDLTSHAGVSMMEGEVAELVPRTPLQPNTRYVIRALPMGGGNLDPDTERLEFKTGSEPASTERLMPPSLELKVLTGFVSGCISAAAIGCMNAGDSSILVEIDDPNGHLLMRDVVTGDVAAHIPKAAGCGRAWTRSASGRLSDVTELCGSARSTRTFRMGDLDGFGCTLDRSPEEQASASDAGVEPDHDDDSGFGCSAVRPAGGSGGFSALLVLAAMSVVRRARRGSRRIRG